MKFVAISVAVLGLLPLQVVASPPELGIVRELPPMHQSRAGHTSTRLGDGSVLIVGGFMGDEHEIAGVELFDADRQRFHSIGNAITPRQSHTANLLPDGRVLIAGGYDAQVRMLDGAEIFDPQTRKFVAAGRMNTPRANHIAITLRDGRVALLGGGEVDVFDSQSGAFTTLSGLTIPRGTLQAAALLDDGRVFIAMTDKSTAILDLQSHQLTPSASMQVSRTKFDAIVLTDGRVLVTGGTDEHAASGKFNSAEIFDPSLKRFTPVATMNKGRYKHRGASLLLPSGKVLIAGGAQQAELYDPAANTFTLVEGEARLYGHFSAVTMLKDRRVLITGGYRRGDTLSNGAWLYEF